MLLTEAQALIRDTAREFARARLAPGAAARDRESRFPQAEIAEMGALGFMGMLVPEDWGGAGADHLAYAIALEEIAAADGACSTIMSVHNSVACMPLLRFGSAAQKDRDEAVHHLGVQGRSGDRLRGDRPGQGQTRHLGLPGTHRFARLARGAYRGKARPAFLRHGADRARRAARARRHDAGRRGRGVSDRARQSGGRADRHRGAGRRHGQPIVAHQAVGFRLADMATRIAAARLLVHDAARRRDAGLPCLTEASMAKLFASEIAEQVCTDAIQIHGGYGYLSDFPVERIYRDVRVCQIYEGTSDIQRLVIARALVQG
jgi:alkylation response protein AidB-like acyl-CoA dehydrogenase